MHRRLWLDKPAEYESLRYICLLHAVDANLRTAGAADSHFPCIRDAAHKQHLDPTPHLNTMLTQLSSSTQI